MEPVPEKTGAAQVTPVEWRVNTIPVYRPVFSPRNHGVYHRPAYTSRKQKRGGTGVYHRPEITERAVPCDEHHTKNGDKSCARCTA